MLEHLQRPVSPCSKQGNISRTYSGIHFSRSSECHNPNNNQCSVAGCKRRSFISRDGDSYCKKHFKRKLQTESTNYMPSCDFVCCSRPISYNLGESLYCHEHFMVMVSPLALRPCARDADRAVCNFVGCSVAASLTWRFCGVFCDLHLPIVTALRRQIQLAKFQCDEISQIRLRYDEICVRKFLEPGHVHCYYMLALKYSPDRFVWPNIEMPPMAQLLTTKSQTSTTRFQALRSQASSDMTISRPSCWNFAPVQLPQVCTHEHFNIYG